MEVRFAPDLQDRLSQRAVEQGIEPGQLVQELLLQYFEEEDRYSAAIGQAEAELARGEFLTHEEVGLRLARFLQHP